MRKQTAKWKMKGGKKVRICDMTDEHLLNAIRYLLNHAERLFKSEQLIASSFLCSLQGEMAQYYAEQELDRLEEEGVDGLLENRCPIFLKMVEDAKRRGLERHLPLEIR